MTKEPFPYEDIINLPHHVSATRPQMSLYDRAAQFSPFAALTGHSEAIHETARLTDKKAELSEDVIAILNEKLTAISENIDKECDVTITYFVPDKKKAGGAYISHTSKVKKINEYDHTVIMYDGTVIPIDDICEIDSILFRDMELD